MDIERRKDMMKKVLRQMERYGMLANLFNIIRIIQGLK